MQKPDKKAIKTTRKTAKPASRKTSLRKVSPNPASSQRQLAQQPRRSSVSEENLQRFANIVLRLAQERFAGSPFTRDDILTSISKLRLDSDEDWANETAGINDTTTGTRYRKVCDAVTYLLIRQKLTALDYIGLCLPGDLAALQERAKGDRVHLEYLSTARRVIQDNYQSGAVVDVMAMVDRWKSDGHLPENVKRMVIRSLMPRLVTERILKRGIHRSEFRVA